MDAQHPLAVVTPTLDGDVLAILAVADAPFTTGQLHRTLSRFSEDGIRKALSRLRKQGIVLSEPAGNAYLYRFNRDHLAAEPIRAMATLRQTLLSRIEERLASWKLPPVYAAVFGSMARATAGTASDIDLVLIKNDVGPDDQWEAQVAELANDVSKWTGNDARPITFTVSDLASRRTEPLFAEILADGLTVFGQRSWLQRQIGGA
jgi:predicted nucleotidyltransferase